MTETATETTETEADATMGGDDMQMIPLPAEGLSVLIACGEIVRRIILRAWNGLENPNHDILSLAEAFGLQRERAPTEDEVAEGAFTADDTVLELNPVFAEMMAGFDAGRAEALAELLPEPDEGEGEEGEPEEAGTA